MEELYKYHLTKAVEAEGDDEQVFVPHTMRIKAILHVLGSLDNIYG